MGAAGGRGPLSEAQEVAVRRQIAAIDGRLPKLTAPPAHGLRPTHGTRSTLDPSKADPIGVGVPAAEAFVVGYGATWYFMHTRHAATKGAAYTERQIEWRRAFLKIDVTNPRFPAGVKDLAAWSMAVALIAASLDRKKNK